MLRTNLSHIQPDETERNRQRQKCAIETETQRRRKRTNEKDDKNYICINNNKTYENMYMHLNVLFGIGDDGINMRHSYQKTILYFPFCVFGLFPVVVSTVDSCVLIKLSQTSQEMKFVPYVQLQRIHRFFIGGISFRHGLYLFVFFFCFSLPLYFLSHFSCSNHSPCH